MRRQTLRKTAIYASFLLFPVTIYYFSPELILMAAAEGILSGSAVVFGLLFLSGLFFGRAWCGWLCPGGGLQEACLRVVRKPVGPRRWIKYLIFWPWLGGILILAARAGGFHGVNPLYQMPRGISFVEPGAWVIYFGFVTLIALLALTAGRRGFCHHACWMAPFLIAGASLRERFGWPALRLEGSPAACSGCGRCTSRCPMSLDVQGMVRRGRMADGDCILCGECVDGCPRGAIRYTFRPPARLPVLPVKE
ncbi:MAG: 4Fe-4S binding protein [Chitinophagales bacterium]